MQECISRLRSKHKLNVEVAQLKAADFIASCRIGIERILANGQSPLLLGH